MKVNLTIEGKQYQVTLKDLTTRPIIAEVDGQTYEVWPEEEQASIPTVKSTLPHLLLLPLPHPYRQPLAA